MAATPASLRFGMVRHNSSLGLRVFAHFSRVSSSFRRRRCTPLHAARPPRGKGASEIARGFGEFVCEHFRVGPTQHKVAALFTRGTRTHASPHTLIMLQGDFAPKRGRRRKASSETFERTPLRLSQDDLETPTTTVKDNCLSWDLHEAAATQGGAEAVRRFLVGGGDPGCDQWGNSALHVRESGNKFPFVLFPSVGADANSSSASKKFGRTYPSTHA